MSPDARTLRSPLPTIVAVWGVQRNGLVGVDLRLPQKEIGRAEIAAKRLLATNVHVPSLVGRESDTRALEIGAADWSFLADPDRR